MERSTCAYKMGKRSGRQGELLDHNAQNRSDSLKRETKKKDLVESNPQMAVQF